MKSIFEQYRDLKKEIRQLESRLKRIPNGEVVDYAMDYSTGKGRTIILRGQADERPRNTVRGLLEERKATAMEMVVEVEKAISGCPHARTRVVLSGYYVEGKTLGELAAELNLDERTVRREKENYFKSCRKCPPMPKKMA